MSARPATAECIDERKGGAAGPVPGLRRSDRVGVQDRPVHLLRRPVPPALQEVDLGRRPGAMRILAPGGRAASTRAPGIPGRPGGCRAPGGRAPGWPARAAGSRRRPPKPALGGRLRAPRGAVGSGGDERASGPACRGGPVEAVGGPIPRRRGREGRQRRPRQRRDASDSVRWCGPGRRSGEERRTKRNQWLKAPQG